MVRRKADDIAKYIGGDKLYSMLREAHTMGERRSLVEAAVLNLNITKCGFGELEVDEPGSTGYLLYLLQEESGIDLGLCPYYKVWFNARGQQDRCRFNEGPVQVRCAGSLTECEHPKEYKEAQEKNPITLD